MILQSLKFRWLKLKMSKSRCSLNEADISEEVSGWSWKCLERANWSQLLSLKWNITVRVKCCCYGDRAARSRKQDQETNRKEYVPSFTLILPVLFWYLILVETYRIQKPEDKAVPVPESQKEYKGWV